jgi:bifunctional UDP-N-acetylglucosamine pyrophosphorylase/glucosamine-1-phosphate N-acetyltransferase
MSIAAIILAAGKSTRMKSRRVKVLHEICGRSMLAYVLDAARSAGAERIVVVVGHDRESVMREFAHQEDIQWVHQQEQKGTGHAVQVCREALEDFTGEVFVLAGDGPLIRAQTLANILEAHRAEHAAMTLATSVIDHPAGYGRIVRDSAGDILAIVEEKDATAEQRNIREVNPSYYLFDNRALFEALDQIKPNNQKGEYYLTDALAILRGQGRKVTALAAVPAEDVLSINSRLELAVVSRVMQRRIQAGIMESGVTIVSPENTWIEFGAKIGQDTVLEAFAWVGAGASIAPASHVPANTVIGRDGKFPA